MSHRTCFALITQHVCFCRAEALFRTDVKFSLIFAFFTGNFIYASNAVTNTRTACLSLPIQKSTFPTLLTPSIHRQD